MHSFKTAVRQTAKSLLNSLPVLLGAIGLVGIASSLIPSAAYTALFSRNWFADSFIGALLGSVLSGNPITSYIIGGEMLKHGVSLMAVTSFIVAWVTVGLVQLPAEIMLLGKRFAIARNLVSFAFSIFVSMITVMALRIL